MRAGGYYEVKKSKFEELLRAGNSRRALHARRGRQRQQIEDEIELRSDRFNKRNARGAHRVISFVRNTAGRIKLRKRLGKNKGVLARLLPRQAHFQTGVREFPCEPGVAAEQRDVPDTPAVVTAERMDYHVVAFRPSQNDRVERVAFGCEPDILGRKLLDVFLPKCPALTFVGPSPKITHGRVS